MGDPAVDISGCLLLAYCKSPSIPLIGESNNSRISARVLALVHRLEHLFKVASSDLAQVHLCPMLIEAFEHLEHVGVRFCHHSVPILKIGVDHSNVSLELGALTKDIGEALCDAIDETNLLPR